MRCLRRIEGVTLFGKVCNSEIRNSEDRAAIFLQIERSQPGAYSQEFVMGGLLRGLAAGGQWRSEGKAPSRQRQGGLGGPNARRFFNKTNAF